MKAVDSPFYGDGNNPPPEGGNQDSSYYKGGPSPFKDFDYSNNDYTRQNVCFDDEKTMSHLYDRHARDCFGIQEPRNKESLERFKGKLRNYVESLKTDRINGSFRYEIPAFNFWDDSTDLVVTVDATTNKCVGLRNATDFQLDNLEKDGNIGFDSRPLMVLKLRGPKQ